MTSSRRTISGSSLVTSVHSWTSLAQPSLIRRLGPQLILDVMLPGTAKTSRPLIHRKLGGDRGTAVLCALDDNYAEREAAHDAIANGKILRKRGCAHGEL